MIEGVVENMLASAIGAILLFLCGKIFTDIFFIGFFIPERKGKGEEEKVKFVRIYHKFPWRNAYKYAHKTADSLKNGDAEDLYEPTIIIGIGRGGAIYGSIFSYYMKETPMIPKEGFNQYVIDPFYQIPGSGSTYNDYKKRADDFLINLSSQLINGIRVLVITHKSFGRILVQTIENKEHLHFRSIPMYNASIRRVVIDNRTMNISYLIKVLDNDVVEPNFT